MQWLDTVCRDTLDRPLVPVDPVERIFERDRRERDPVSVLAVLGGALAMSTAIFLIGALGLLLNAALKALGL